ncbi:MAG: AAA family ATPase [Gammaproteobacteria bacterium]|nr:AAA family ATPase [Gammaproteobacteria bacterium]
MKLKTIRIEKFRAIRSSEIRVNSELALVGQNSAGKSSVLRALNAFFNFNDEKEAFDLGRHNFQKTSTAEIDLSFVETPVACTIARVTIGGDEVRVRLRFKRTDSWQVYTNGIWASVASDFHTELRKFISYVYVPLRRDHEISGWGDHGLLQTAVEAWVKHHTSRRDSISPRVAELGQMIQRRAFDGLSKQLRKVTPINGAFTFNLEYTRPPDYSLLLRDLILRVTEGTTTVDLQDCGSGTQSMTAFALYSYLAELEGNTYILGIEEPEQNLHPQAQRELLANLRALPLQVLFTTHSTVILDDLRHDEVVLCRRVKSATRGIEVTTTQLAATFWSTSGLNEERYYHFYRRRNSEFFFSNFVILTESPIDAELVKELLRQAKTDTVTHSVSILSVDGVQSLPYAYHLLRALDLDFATVVDKDYFMPYLHDELETSRDARGFPRYRKEFNKGTLLENMLPSTAERATLLNLFHGNHSRAMDILEKFNVFCFKWSLEIDLVNSTTARQLLFQGLNIAGGDQTTNTLLVTRKKALKKLETLLPVVQGVQPSNLPNSYKRLRRTLPDLIKKTGFLH